MTPLEERARLVGRLNDANRRITYAIRLLISFALLVGGSIALVVATDGARLPELLGMLGVAYGIVTAIRGAYELFPAVAQRSQVSVLLAMHDRKHGTLPAARVVRVD